MEPIGKRDLRLADHCSFSEQNVAVIHTWC